MSEWRSYPQPCLSAFCGKTSAQCPDCRYYPELLEFKQWRDRTSAVCTDPIWCPTIYTATRKDRT